MPITRRRFQRILLGVLGAALILPARAAELIEGRDWRALMPPQPVKDPGRIEVLEFFSYGCPHCSQLNPLIKTWAAGLPPDVTFERVPVTFGRAAWANVSRLYFALDQTGDLARLDQAVFDAISKERRNLFTEQAIVDWVADQGMDAEQFKAAFSGFTTETRFIRANALAERYKVDAVPMIVVGGRYVVMGTAAKGYEDLFGIADGLIAKARAGAVGQGG